MFAIAPKGVGWIVGREDPDKEAPNSLSYEEATFAMTALEKRAWDMNAKTKRITAMGKEMNKSKTQIAIRKLLQFKLGYFPTCAGCNGPMRTYPYNQVPKAELAEDSTALFFSEAYLYNLLGKYDARALLDEMRQLCEAVDIPEREIP